MNLNHCLLLLLFPVFIAGAFNYTSCEQAKKPKMMSSCCHIPREDKVSKACRQSLLGQKNTTTNNGEARNLKSDKVALHACIAECIFKANGYLLVNGTANLPVMQKDLQKRYKNDAALAQLMIKSLNSCAASAEKRAQQFKWLHSKGECNYYPATLLACSMEQIYENCPASKWKNSEDCLAMRKYLTACDDVKSGKK